MNTEAPESLVGDKLPQEIKPVELVQNEEEEEEEEQEQQQPHQQPQQQQQQQQEQPPQYQEQEPHEYKEYKDIILEENCDFEKNISENFSNLDTIHAIRGKIHNSKIQEVSDPQVKLFVSEESAFATTLYYAFAYHIPMQLSPDQVWLEILQGFSEHVEANSKELREFFVDFDGKKTLIVRRDSFVFGAQNNDWPGVFNEFEVEIKQYIGEENHSILVGQKFSTTTPLVSAVNSLTLMDIMKSYFDYKVMTMCGIPQVRLLGTREDWVHLIERTKELEKYLLEWWIPLLVPILEKFLEAYDGKVDNRFWNSSYKIVSTSGSGAVSKVNGWINNFYPYINKKRSGKMFNLEKIYERHSIENSAHIYVSWGAGRYMGPNSQEEDKAKEERINELFNSSIEADDIPIGITSTPFKWNYHESESDMVFFGGFVGVALEEGQFITPHIGWAVAEKDDNKKKYEF